MNWLERVRLSDGFIELMRTRWEGKPQPHPTACSCPECVQWVLDALEVLSDDGPYDGSCL